MEASKNQLPPPRFFPLLKGLETMEALEAAKSPHAQGTAIGKRFWKRVDFAILQGSIAVRGIRNVPMFPADLHEILWEYMTRTKAVEFFSSEKSGTHHPTCRWKTTLDFLGIDNQC